MTELQIRERSLIAGQSNGLSEQLSHNHSVEGHTIPVSLQKLVRDSSRVRPQRALAADVLHSPPERSARLPLSDRSDTGGRIADDGTSAICRRPRQSARASR